MQLELSECLLCDTNVIGEEIEVVYSTLLTPFHLRGRLEKKVGNGRILLLWVRQFQNLANSDFTLCQFVLLLILSHLEHKAIIWESF